MINDVKGLKMKRNINCCILKVRRDDRFALGEHHNPTEQCLDQFKQGRVALMSEYFTQNFRLKLFFAHTKCTETLYMSRWVKKKIKSYIKTPKE